MTISGDFKKYLTVDALECSAFTLPMREKVSFDAKIQGYAIKNDNLLVTALNTITGQVVNIMIYIGNTKGPELRAVSEGLDSLIKTGGKTKFSYEKQRT